MKTLRLITFTCLLVLATPVLAQEGHQHHGGAAADATATPEVAEIAPGGQGKGGCKHTKGSGAADTAALERRIDELEKRLDLMQLLLQREAR